MVVKYILGFVYRLFLYLVIVLMIFYIVIGDKFLCLFNGINEFLVVWVDLWLNDDSLLVWFWEL